MTRRSKRVPNTGAILLTPADIRQWRIKAGHLQSTVAVRFGVSVRTVSRWENGSSYPPPMVCEAIAKGWNRPIPYTTITLARAPRTA